MDVVNFLIQKSANVNAVDVDERTALHMAASTGNVNLVKFFIQEGANIHAIDKDWATALHVATSTKNGSS